MNHMISSVYLPLLPHPRLRRPCRSRYPSGAANGGRLLFGNFFLAMQEKVTSCRSATGDSTRCGHVLNVDFPMPDLIKLLIILGYITVP